MLMLMELIIINIGLQKGIIGHALFSMLVVMALVTTLMTSPLFEAVYGKTARACGEDNRTALGIGALMNSRGLMELIIINIGLQKGIIGPTLFSMLVLMAIITTMMASPLFEWVYGRKARSSGDLEHLHPKTAAAG